MKKNASVHKEMTFHIHETREAICSKLGKTPSFSQVPAMPKQPKKPSLSRKGTILASPPTRKVYSSTI
jgi:hypothetical protein